MGRIWWESRNIALDSLDSVTTLVILKKRTLNKVKKRLWGLYKVVEEYLSANPDAYAGCAF